MTDAAATFQAELVATLVPHLVKGGHQQLDAAVYQRLMATPDLDWELLAPAFERAFREVQERMVGPLCGERKHCQRAWTRGAEVALARRGMPAHELVLNITHLLLLTCYDEAIMIPVFAHTCGWVAGQAWAIADRSPETRDTWRSAVLQGTTLAMGTLRRQVGELVPGMADDEAQVLEAARDGFRVGSLALLGRVPAWAR